MKYSLESILGEDPDEEYAVWGDQAGGKIVDTWEEDGVTYVNVVFENSPDKKYKYIKDN